MPVFLFSEVCRGPWNFLEHQSMCEWKCVFSYLGTVFTKALTQNVKLCKVTQSFPFLITFKPLSMSKN